jgi:hypothetical protein
MYFGLQKAKPPPCPLLLTKQGGSIQCIVLLVVRHIWFCIQKFVILGRNKWKLCVCKRTKRTCPSMWVPQWIPFYMVCCDPTEFRYGTHSISCKMELLHFSRSFSFVQDSGAPNGKELLPMFQLPDDIAHFLVGCTAALAPNRYPRHKVFSFCGHIF